MYSVTDAVVVGSPLITLLRKCDRVTADASKYGRGQVLRLETASPVHDTAPERVTNKANNTVTLDGGELQVTLPALSWNVIRVE